MITIFLAGMFVGGVVGYTVAALAAISKRDQEWEDRGNNEHS